MGKAVLTIGNAYKLNLYGMKYNFKCIGIRYDGKYVFILLDKHLIKEWSMRFIISVGQAFYSKDLEIGYSLRSNESTFVFTPTSKDLSEINNESMNVSTKWALNKIKSNMGEKLSNFNALITKKIALSMAIKNGISNESLEVRDLDLSSILRMEVLALQEKWLVIKDFHDSQLPF